MTDDEIAFRVALNVLRDTLECGRLPSGQALTADAKRCMSLRPTISTNWRARKPMMLLLRSPSACRGTKHARLSVSSIATVIDGTRQRHRPFCGAGGRPQAMSPGS
jgi:hypothetical protein